jgi:hypothetical protein
MVVVGGGVVVVATGVVAGVVGEPTGFVVVVVGVPLLVTPLGVEVGGGEEVGVDVAVVRPAVVVDVVDAGGREPADDPLGERGTVVGVVGLEMLADPALVAGADSTLDAAEFAVCATRSAVVTPEPTKIACVRRRMFVRRRRRWFGVR